jgi:hypothetical protein
MVLVLSTTKGIAGLAVALNAGPPTRNSCGNLFRTSARRFQR